MTMKNMEDTFEGRFNIRSFLKKKSADLFPLYP